MRFGHVLFAVAATWILMIPPRTGTADNPGADTNAPLAQWHRLVTFDSEAQCNDGINQFRASPDPAHVLDAAKASAQCVSGDDPRLKGD